MSVENIPTNGGNITMSNFLDDKTNDQICIIYWNRKNILKKFQKLNAPEIITKNPQKLFNLVDEEMKKRNISSNFYNHIIYNHIEKMIDINRSLMIQSPCIICIHFENTDNYDEEISKCKLGLHKTVDIEICEKFKKNPDIPEGMDNYEIIYDEIKSLESELEEVKKELGDH